MLLLRNVCPWGGMPVDLLLVDGKIAAIGAGLSAPDGSTVEDCAGAIVLPGFVDAHSHVDKTLLDRPWQSYQPARGTIERVRLERSARAAAPDLSVSAQAGVHLRASVARGTTRMRTHVDVDVDVGLRHVEGVLEARESHRQAIDLQVVAFPQCGLLLRPGTMALMEQALQLGADVVGGISPSTVDRDPVRHLDAVFGLAEKYHAPVDIHLHEPGTLGAFALELIAERTLALSMQGRVTISHGFCLGMVDEARLAELTKLLLDCRISVMTHAPGKALFPPVKKLWEQGVNICAGSDNVRDAWTPYGDADMLERAMLLGYRSDFRTDDELGLTLEIVTRGGCRALGAEDPQLAPGAPGDLVVLRARTVAEAVVARPPRELVIKSGKVVARQGAFAA